MALCSVEARPDMYGLGIRLAFYVVWLSAVFFEYFHEEDLPDIRLLGFLLSLAVTIGMTIQISKHTLQPIDINLSLILTMGIFVFFIPVYGWRIITRFNEYLDPLRHSAEELGPPVFRLARFLLLLVNTGVGIWFFTTYLVDLKPGCEQYAFFLSRMRIYDKIYVVFGAIFFIGIVIVCIGLFLFQAGWMSPFIAYERPPRHRRKILKVAMRQYRLISNLCVFALLVAAVELPIRWNKLSKANEIETAAQLIPLILVVGFVFRVCGQHYLYHRDGEDSDEEEAEPQLQPDPGLQPAPNLRLNEQPDIQDVRWSSWMPQIPGMVYK